MLRADLLTCLLLTDYMPAAYMLAALYPCSHAYYEHAYALMLTPEGDGKVHTVRAVILSEFFL